MTEVQKLAKIMVLKDLYKEYELLAKYNGGTDYDRYCALEMAIKALEQEPKTDNIKALGEELRTVRGGIKYENVLIGYNMAVAICNKYLSDKEEQESKQGQWDKDGACPFCGYLQQWDDDNYCGHCGAKLTKINQD